MKTIDITPTWEGLLPALLAVISDGNPEGRKIAREELRKMSQAADLHNAHQKNMENKIAIIWGTEDVIGRARDKDIFVTEPQAIEILQTVNRTHDATLGISWETIDCAIDYYDGKKIKIIGDEDDLRALISDSKKGFELQEDDLEKMINSLQFMEAKDRNKFISPKDYKKLIAEAKYLGII